MSDTPKNSSWLIAILIGLAIVIYLGYKWYNYSQCKSAKDSPCKKVQSKIASSLSSSNMRGSVALLTDEEKATMNSLADKANAGTSLTTAEWSLLNALVFRYVKNGGIDPVVRQASSKANDGKTNCSFWKGETCE